MPSAPAKLITNSQSLKELADSLSKSKVIAVDTESNSLHAYQEQVCLIQFTNEDGDSLVDPLALDNIDPLIPIFENPSIEKIFHAAEYDLIVLHRDFDIALQNLFDTMIAARIIGRQRVGLGSLLEEEFNIVLAKKYQRADWGKRPIKADMLEYARLDTHHLVELRDKLESELHAIDRWPLASEDFARMPKSILNNNTERQAAIWRIKGVRDLDSKEIAVLNELSKYRDQQAQRADLPLFKIMGDRTLVAIAALRPITLRHLEEVKGMTPGQIRRFGNGLLNAVQRGLKAQPMKRPRLGNYDAEYGDRLEKLRNWRKLAARKIEVESDVILPRDIMEKLARAHPATQNELSDLMQSLPWRLDKYGAQILATLN